MIKGLYTAAAGMLSSLIETDTLASNLANVSTIGFKANRTDFQSFPSMLLQKLEQGQSTAIGALSNGSSIYKSFVNHMQGTLRPTGNPFDVAIHGDGFFTVKSPTTGQISYTRAGNFTVNAEGFLTTVNGDFVQGAQGNIEINLNDGPVHIERDGTMTAKGRTIDQLKITRFQDNQTLLKTSDNLYQASAASQILNANTAGAGVPGAGGAGFTIEQGSLEESNVNPVAELVSNIQGMRLYEALQKNIHLQNDMLTKAVNQVGLYKA